MKYISEPLKQFKSLSTDEQSTWDSNHAGVFDTMSQFTKFASAGPHKVNPDADKREMEMDRIARMRIAGRKQQRKPEIELSPEHTKWYNWN